MRCPKCRSENRTSWELLECNRAQPAICNECGSKYYVRRFFSGAIFHGFFGSGLVFIAMLLAFGAWGSFGTIAVLVVAGLLWLIFLFIEGNYFPTILLTEAMEASGKKYLLAVRLVIGASLLVLVYALFL